MRLALDEARQAAREDEVPVGAVLVAADGRLLARAHNRLAGVVYGAADRLAGAVTSCTETLDQPFFNHRVWHMGGVLARESVDLLQDFFAGRRD